MASTYLTRTLGTATNLKKFTISFWVKRCGLSALQEIISSNSAANYGRIHFEANDRLRFSFGSTSNGLIETNRLFRDTNSWYHIVCVADTTLATADDRLKIYVNGTQETSFASRTNPTLNEDSTRLNSANIHSVGSLIVSGSHSQYLNGDLAHFHFIDGTAYDASYFGQTETASGIWKPKTSPSVTYGTNGFFLKFQDSSSLGDDSSGNTNDLTSYGTGTQTLDTPSNVFATANATMGNLTATYSNGNLTVANTTSGLFGGASTLGASSGKYYAEYKITAQSAACGHLGIDGDPQESARNNNFAGQNSWSYGYNANGNKFNNNSGTSYGDTFTLNDIIMVAMDLDNNYVYFGKNGTWQNSGDPTSGATGTGAAYSISSSPPSGAYFFVSGDGSGSNSATIAHNYGNGYFGTTAVASANSDSAGLGQFEYAVPSGYYALCTKNIASYG